MSLVEHLESLPVQVLSVRQSSCTLVQGLLLALVLREPGLRAGRLGEGAQP